jgi:hypothetical protein
MLLGRTVPRARLPAGRGPAWERLAAGLAGTGAPAGSAAGGLEAALSRVRLSGRAGADVPPLRDRPETPPSLAAFGADEAPAGRTATGLPAAASLTLFPGRPDDGAAAPEPRGRLSSGRPGPEGRAGRADDGLDALPEPVRFSGRSNAEAAGPSLRVRRAAGRPGPGFPEGLERFCGGRAAPEDAAGLAEEREGPGFPERLLMGMQDSSRGRTPRVVPHSVPVCPPPDKRAGQ